MLGKTAELKVLLGLEKHAVASIVGAGGKTSLMFALAKELARSSKVLVTTTTKMYVPNKESYDFIALENVDNLTDFCESSTAGIYVLGSSVDENNKLLSISEDSIKLAQNYFDYILIEADGSKGLPVKGWNATEPVISAFTNITIGILDIQVLGTETNEDNVHRVKEFMELTETSANEAIKAVHLKNLILKPKGLFKNSLGKRVIFVNKVERKEDKPMAKALAESLAAEGSKLIDKIIIGSLKNKKAEIVFERM